MHALDLPTVHAADKAALDMYDDARAVREAVEAIGGPVVVVAHSYGGVPTTQGAAGLPNVSRIVYISAFVLDKGESLLAGVGGVQPSWWNVQGALATAGVPGEPPEQLFYNDLPDDQARAAAAGLTSQAVKPFSDLVTEVAWRTVPTTYLVTLRDAVFPPEAQEGLASRAGSTSRTDRREPFPVPVPPGGDRRRHRRGGLALFLPASPLPSAGRSPAAAR